MTLSVFLLIIGWTLAGFILPEFLLLLSSRGRISRVSPEMNSWSAIAAMLLAAGTLL